ncbi:glutamate receptor ionotropic, kainate 2-like [Chrysoperla carnea]|uniref:glutamate receptor ionotropic, kainate 2-like n=1 Tax=Chrysoperla carnea TaxID=189513 RepID=UPI001D069168|nr:glutamate receptor ionotropic, kainate 2-like [Chrysoperla carnea]
MFININNFRLFVSLFLCVFFVILPELCLADRKQRIPIGAIFHEYNMEMEMVFRNKLNYINNLYEEPYLLIPNIQTVAKVDSFKAGKIACNITEDGIAAMFGPQNDECAGIVEAICYNLKIPNFQTHWQPKKSTYQDAAKMAIKLYPDAHVLSVAINDILKTMEWKSFTILYEDDDALLRLQEVFLDHKTFDNVITIRQLTGFDYRSLLKEVHESGERQIILDCNIDTTVEVFRQAAEVKMTGEYINYYILNLDTHTLRQELLQHALTNMTIISLIDPNFGEARKHIVDEWTMEMPSLTLTADTIPTELALMYDALDVFYQGLKMTDSLMSLKFEKVDCNPKSSINRYGIDTWTDGEQFYDVLKKVRSDGLSGPIQFDENGYRTDFTLQIMDISDDGFRQIGTWDPTNGVSRTISEEDSLAQYSAALRNKTFKVASRIGEPHLMWKNESAEGNERFEGYAMDLIHEISKIIGFKYEFYLTPDNKYGGLDKKTKKWNGLIKELLERKADLAICDLTITFDRRSAVDFTMPFMTLGISILFRKPVARPPQLFSFMAPLSVEVWLYMALAFLGVAFAVYIIARMCPKDWENPTPQDPNPTELENIWSLPNCIWLSLGTIMCLGCDLLPKGSSTRITVVLWGFFALIVIQSYIANLTAFLTMEKMGDSIKNAEDLAKQTTIKYGTVQGASTANFFRDSNFSVYQKMWSTMESTRPSVFVDGNAEGVKRVLRGQGTYAFLMESTSIEYVTARECELTQIGGKLDSKGYGIAMPVNSPYRTDISGAVLKLQESGKLSTLKTKWWKDMHGGRKCDEDPSSNAKEENANEMGIDNVAGIFIVLVAGTMFAIFILICEVLWNIRTIAVEHKITPTEALKSELRFAFQIFNKEKPAKPYTPSEASSDEDTRSVAASVFRSASSFLRLDNIIEKKDN